MTGTGLKKHYNVQPVMFASWKKQTKARPKLQDAKDTLPYDCMMSYSTSSQQTLACVI